MVSQPKLVEEGEEDEKESRYQTALAESGLFVLVPQ